MNVAHFRCPLDTCDHWRFVDKDARYAEDLLAKADTELHEHFETHSSAEVLAAMREMVRERAILRAVADRVRPER